MADGDGQEIMGVPQASCQQESLTQIMADGAATALCAA
jgi:hypothetical protein